MSGERERALAAAREMVSGSLEDLIGTLTEDPSTQEYLRALEQALERLANPTSVPRSEEGALLQIEVQQIARAALSGRGGEQDSPQ